MKSNWRNLILSLVVVILVGFAFVAGWVSRTVFDEAVPLLTTAPTPTPATELAQDATPEELRQQFEIFWQVWSLVENNFYDPSRIDYTKMIYGAISGMVDSVQDDYTFFSTPAQTDVSRTRLEGDYEGIGAYIGERDGYPMIQGPVNDETPAAKAGLRLGDIIIAVDGWDTTDQPLEEVIARIKGPAGTEVTLTIVREGEAEPLDVTLPRARIEVRSAEGEMLDNGVAYIRLSVFGDTTAQELDQVLSELLAQDPKGLILDLRGNGGGYLYASQEVLGRFLDEKVATWEADQNDNRTPRPIIPGDIQVLDLPMVVLVDGGSASASEITAGALQDYGRAILIGEQTFGKGSIQNVFDLSDGSSVRVTIAHWLTAKERVIQDVGLTPDIVVPLTPEDYDAGLDPQLDAAGAYLLGQPLPPSAATPTPVP